MTNLIELDKDITPVDQHLPLKYGMQLSRNISIDALTSGPVNPLTYPINISRTEHLIEDYFFSQEHISPVHDLLKPLYNNRWQLASNLQHLAQGAIEPMINEFKKDLVVYAGFIHAGKNNSFPLSPHGTGEGVDIFIEGWDLNMFHLVGEVMKMLKNSNVYEIGLCFNQRSWLHIGVIGANHVFGRDINSPRYFTRDFVTGQAWSGFYPARGLMK